MRALPVLAFAALLLTGSCGGIGSGSSGSASAPGANRGTGPICGARAIIGRPVPRIDGPGECGIRAPVEVHAIAGVALDPPATLDCEAAGALQTWVARGAKPEISRAGGRLASIEVAAAYACRNRNNARAGRLSEHARGQAIDIAAFRLADGRAFVVEAGWNDPETGPILKRIHAAGCGTFGTTLGPGSDGMHEDHLHYDVARYDNTSYCR